MSDEPKVEPDDNIVAIHEAGHLVVEILVGRSPIKVSIDKVDGRRGCFWKTKTERGWDDFSEMLSLIAGPRAQVELLPHSVAEEKLHLFQKKSFNHRQALGNSHRVSMILRDGITMLGLSTRISQCRTRWQTTLYRLEQHTAKLLSRQRKLS